jgi:hypothetical protein
MMYQKGLLIWLEVGRSDLRDPLLMSMVLLLLKLSSAPEYLLI